MRFVNWSWLIFQVTFGNCLVNSSESLNGRSNPVSKYAFNTTGSVPHDGPAAAALDEGAVLASVLAAGAVVGAVVAAGDGVVTAPGDAQPANRMAVTANAAMRIPGTATVPRPIPMLIM